MGKYRGVLDELDPMGRQNRMKRDLERALREERAAKRFPMTEIPDGSITNEALADPVAGGYVSQSVTGWAPTVAGSYLIDTAVTVPSDFAACIVNLTGRAYGVNTTAADDYLYARAEVYSLTASYSATALPVHAAASGAPNDAALNVSPLSVVMSGLTAGDTFNVRLWVATAVADWTADLNNTADLTGSLTWYA